MASMTGCSKPSEIPTAQVAQLTTEVTPVSFNESAHGNYLLTNEDEVPLSGSCETGSKIQITSDSTDVHEVACEENNTWSYSLNTGADGQHILGINQMNSSGVRTGNKQMIIVTDKKPMSVAKVVSGNRVRTSGTSGQKPKVVFQISDMGTHEDRYRYAIVTNPNEVVPDERYQEVIPVGDRISIQLTSSLKSNVNEKKWIKLIDQAGNSIVSPYPFDIINRSKT